MSRRNDRGQPEPRDPPKADALGDSSDTRGLPTLCGASSPMADLLGGLRACYDGDLDLGTGGLQETQRNG